jgi:chitinase
VSHDDRYSRFEYRRLIALESSPRFDARRLRRRHHQPEARAAAGTVGLSAAMKRVLILLLAVFCTACRTSSPRYRIVGYVYRHTDIYRIGAEKLTHINYAFGSVSINSQIVLDEPDAAARLAQLQSLKAKNPRLKVIVSVGGWGADNFSDAAFNQTRRDRFAASAIDLIRRYAIDGIDLDWEYPGQPGPGIAFRDEDKENFTLLLKTLRERLDALSDERHRTGSDRYTLSIATAGGDYFEHTEMARLHPFVDWFNIMAYDFTGEWTKTTGHHAALHWYKVAGSETGPSGESFVEQYLAAGIPSRKLVLGVPFYGRAWCGVYPGNRGLYQPYEAYESSYPYSALARNFVNQNGFTRYWDRVARVPYLWNPSSATLITYEDPSSLREKARFVMRRHLGGVMYWEHSEDPDEILLTALFYNLR